MKNKVNKFLYYKFNYMNPSKNTIKKKIMMIYNQNKKYKYKIVCNYN